MHIEVDYQYYNDHFPKVSEDRFNTLIYRSKRFVFNQLGVQKSLTRYEQRLIKDCICEVLNQVDINESTKGLSSISNNGYSKSFQTMDNTQQQQSIDDIIQSYFGGTRLLKSRFIAY